MNQESNIPDARLHWKPSSTALTNGDFISIEAYSGYSMLIADPKATEYLLEPEISDKALGDVVLNSLKQSRFLSIEEATELRINGKENYENWVKKIMTKYGYKTKRALFKNMKNCSLDLRNNIILIEPTNHEKLEAWGGDGISESDYVKIPADSPPEAIGKALRLAFSRCTGMGS
jgi:hypothetical protein